MSLFEKATRQKLRFSTSAGLLSVEDLWDLPLQSATKPSLDGIAIPLFKQIQDSTPVSFVDSTAETGASETVKLKFDIVKHIIDVKKAENKTAADRAAAKAQDQEILSILKDLDNQHLRGLSREELLAKLSNAPKPNPVSA